jgi:hypothetical protein
MARVSNPSDRPATGLRLGQPRDRVAKRPDSGRTTARANVEGRHLLSGFAGPVQRRSAHDPRRRIQGTKGGSPRSQFVQSPGGGYSWISELPHPGCHTLLSSSPGKKTWEFEISWRGAGGGAPSEAAGASSGYILSPWSPRPSIGRAVFRSLPVCCCFGAVR